MRLKKLRVTFSSFVPLLLESGRMLLLLILVASSQAVPAPAPAPTSTTSTTSTALNRMLMSTATTYNDQFADGSSKLPQVPNPSPTGETDKVHYQNQQFPTHYTVTASLSSESTDHEYQNHHEEKLEKGSDHDDDPHHSSDDQDGSTAGHEYQNDQYHHYHEQHDGPNNPGRVSSRLLLKSSSQPTSKMSRMPNNMPIHTKGPVARINPVVARPPTGRGAAAGSPMMIRMDKVPAAAAGKDGKGGLLTAMEVPSEILDVSKKVKYIRGRFLGKGGFAKCYEVSDANSVENNNYLACKIVHKNMLVKEHHREKMVQEIMIHRNLRHPNVVAFHSYFEDDLFVYIVLELCEKKSLMELSKRRRTVTEPEARYFLRQICEAVRYLHDEQKIIHRDLKLGNIFITTNMELKIGDFGLATQMSTDGHRKRTMCGTPNYIAPEVLTKTGHGFEVDIWSVGCILYTLLIGRPPFETDSLKETYKKIRAGDFAIPKSNLSQPARKLIQRLLQVDPTKRPTAREILMDDFLMKCFIPDSLPVSSLTMAPRFPAAAAKNRPMNKPLQENLQANVVTPSSSKNLLQETVVLSKVNSNAMEVSCCSSDSMCDSGYVPIVELMRSLRAQLVNVMKWIKESPKVPENDDESENPSLVPMLFIVKWVDYSDKYGFGFQLSDESIGVTFNDQSKLILMADGVSLNFITREGTESYHSMQRHPPFLEKKVKLISYFKKYMKENLQLPQVNVNINTNCIPRLPNMYTWFRTSRSVVMVLTNGIVQINNFKTHRKIILCPAMGAISIIEPYTPMRTYKLNEFLIHGCSAGMKMDLEYALDKVEAICVASDKARVGAPINVVVRPNSNTENVNPTEQH